MTRDHLLTIDNGTQSVRALIFDPRGRLIAKSRVPIEPYFSTAPGLAEQHPEVFWNAVCAACRQLWSMPGVSKDAIAGAGLTTPFLSMQTALPNASVPHRTASSADACIVINKANR